MNYELLSLEKENDSLTKSIDEFGKLPGMKEDLGRKNDRINSIKAQLNENLSRAFSLIILTLIF